MATANQLDSVIDKTQRLIELCSALLEENDLLKLENDTLNTALDASQTKVKDLEERVKAVKFAKLFSDTNEKSIDIKQKISEFVQEIDKCIVVLKQ